MGETEKRSSCEGVEQVIASPMGLLSEVSSYLSLKVQCVKKTKAFGLPHE